MGFVSTGLLMGLVFLGTVRWVETWRRAGLLAVRLWGRYM